MSAQRNGPAAEAAEVAAARWAMRCAEGLTPAEEAALQAWLNADPGHAPLLEEYRGAWKRFSPLTVTAAGAAASYPPPAAAGRRPRAPVIRLALPLCAAAAAIAVMLAVRHPPAAEPGRAGAVTLVALPLPCEQRTLPDGSHVDLNRGAEIAVAFSPTERRVVLVRGEASFAVAKDPARPFIVAAGGVEARAVGTAFNVRRGGAATEVLVTEGLVRVASGPRSSTGGDHGVVLSARQQIVVAGDPPAAPGAVATLDDRQLAQETAWQPRWLDFDDAPLSEIVGAFNRHNPVPLRIVTPGLASERVTAKFRSDNVESFVRLLERVYRVRVTLQPDRVDLSR